MDPALGSRATGGAHPRRLGVMVVGASVLVAVGATTLALGSEQVRPVDTPTQAAPQGGGLALPGGSTGPTSDGADPFLAPAPYTNAGSGGSGVVHALPQAPAPLVPAANRSSASSTAPATSTTSGSGTSPVPTSSSAPLSMPVSLPSLPSSGGASAMPLLGGGSPQRGSSQGSGGLLSPLLGGGSGNRGQQDEGNQGSESARPTVLAMPGSTVNQLGNDVGQVVGLPGSGGQGSASLLDAPGVLGSVLSGTTGGTTGGTSSGTATGTGTQADGTTGSSSTGSSSGTSAGSATQNVDSATVAALLAQVKAAAERKRAAALAAQQAEQADQQSSQQDQQAQQAAAMRQMVQEQIRKQQAALLAALAAQRAGASQAQQIQAQQSQAQQSQAQQSQAQQSQAQQSQVQQAQLYQAQQAQKALQARVAQQYSTCVAAGKQQQIRAQRDEDGRVTGVTCSTSS